MKSPSMTEPNMKTEAEKATHAVSWGATGCERRRVDRTKPTIGGSGSQKIEEVREDARSIRRWEDSVTGDSLL